MVLVVLVVGAGVGLAVLLRPSHSPSGSSAHTATAATSGGTGPGTTASTPTVPVSDRDVCETHHPYPTTPAYHPGQHQTASFYGREPAPTDVPHTFGSGAPAAIDGTSSPAGAHTIVGCLAPAQVASPLSCTYNAVDLSSSTAVTVYPSVTYRLDVVEIRSGRVLGTRSVAAHGPTTCPELNYGDDSVAPLPPDDAVEAQIRTVVTT